MRRFVCAFFAALLLFAAAFAEESEKHVKQIEDPVVLPLLSMTLDEITATPESRALFGIAAFLEGNLEYTDIIPEESAFVRPSYIGLIDEGDGLLYVATDGKIGLDVFYWPKEGYVLYSILTLACADERADDITREALANSSERIWTIQPEEIRSALERLDEICRR